MACSHQRALGRAGIDFDEADVKTSEELSGS